LNKNGYLLDTDVLIAFLRGKNPEIKAEIKRFTEQNIPLYMSMISLGELCVGAFKSENPEKNLFLVNALKDNVALLDLGEDAVMLYGEIQAALEKAGQPIGDFDVLIACTAIVHNITLVSGNSRHFQRIVSLSGELAFEHWNVNFPVRSMG